MLSLETRLHINEAEVTATVIDGEAIMINLSSGVYYSTEAVGARIWQLAAEGAITSEISRVLAIEYAVPESQVAADVKQIVAQFIEEKLLVSHTYQNTPQPVVAELSPTAYRTPHLEIYREMGHLLALDPPMPGLENIAWDEPRHA